MWIAGRWAALGVVLLAACGGRADRDGVAGPDSDGECDKGEVLGDEIIVRKQAELSRLRGITVFGARCAGNHCSIGYSLPPMVSCAGPNEAAWVPEEP